MTTRPRIVADPPETRDFATELWRILGGQPTLASAAGRVVELVERLTGADAAALGVRDLAGASVRLAGHGRLMDASALGTDPAHDPRAHPLADGGVLAITDTRTDATWPEWSAAAHRHGVGCAHLVGLPPLRDRPAVLELYAARPHAFDGVGTGADDGPGAGVLLDAARQAGLALRQVDRLARLEQAGHARALVGQASGLLMERYHLGADQATAYLVRSAERAGLDVHALARELVAAQDRAAAHTRASFSSPPSPERGDAGPAPRR